MMQRDPGALDDRYDVLVLGGGIYGITLARTLARSGLRVALVERDDFGGAATHNSLKIVHGGFRYVQHLDHARIRESVGAQRTWLAAAPHLVRPLRFAIPTTGWGARGPLALAAGMAVYRALSGDRNAGRSYGARLPGARIGTAARFRKDFPEVASAGISGSASWYDAQILDSGRIVTECMLDAAQAGAAMLNHVEAIGLVVSGRRVRGAFVRDRLGGREYEVHARITVAALGPWGSRLLRQAVPDLPPMREVPWTRNVNIVLSRRIIAGGAVGVYGRQPGDAVIGRARRLFFVTPWRDTSIVGTAHDDWKGAPDDLSVREDELEILLAEVGGALTVSLDAEAIAYVHMGLTPSDSEGGYRGSRAVVLDYESSHGIGGYLEVAGNKYTTAPVVAAGLTRRILRKLGSGNVTPFDFTDPLPYAPRDVGHTEPAGQFGVGGEWTASIYGNRGEELLNLAAGQDDSNEEVRLFRARAMIAVREESAVRLGDVIFRCTDLAERGRLGMSELVWCRDWMAGVHGWDGRRKQAELEAVLGRLRRHRSGGPGVRWTADSGAGRSHDAGEI